MADKNAGFGATDTFNLGSDFTAQPGDQDSTKETAMQFDGDGHGVAKQAVNATTKYKRDYQFKGAGGLAEALDALLGLGGVLNSILCDKIAVKFAAKQYATLSVEGHQHGTNVHVAETAVGKFHHYDVDWAGLIGAAFDGFGIPATLPIPNTNADGACVGLTVEASAEHADAEGADGEHWAGRSHGGKVSVTEEFVGPITPTTTGWVVPSQTAGDSNKEPDKASVKGEKYLAAVVVAA